MRDDIVRSSFFQYYVIDPAGEFEPSLQTEGGLLDSLAGTAVRVNCAHHSAPVAVSARALDQEPVGATTGWEVAAEVDVLVEGQLIVLHGDLMRPPPALGNLAAAGLGRYRLRCSARGRGTGDPMMPAEPLEEQLLEVWPAAEPQPPMVLFGTAY